ncbi:MAG TPA: BTAD domain-containing putative transcriptional regulator [Thermoanaerobaculia bacterium]|nr:BTAD domain-containing putative transcriptional regulator [Thermoanaerobaculia bacterium]
MQIQLFGGFDVRDDGADEVRFESQKVRALLAYLAAQEGRPFSREHVSSLLWPEADGESSRRNLRQALYNLRQSLPALDEALEVSHQNVALNLGPADRVDVVEFLAALRRGLPGDDEVFVAPLRRALELYRGDLLVGFHVRDSAAFEEWQAAAQSRLREAALLALGALVEHFAARGEYEEALIHARRRVEIDPLSEDAHRELMRLYVLAGRRRRALVQFEDMVDLLARDLGVEPLAETRALYDSILTQDLPLDEPVARRPQARPPLGPFVPLVGRAEEWAALEESWALAAAGRARLLLVEGASGIGKTRLVKSFLDLLTSRHRALVVQGRCLDPRPQVAGQPFLDLLRAFDGLPVPAGERGDEAPPVPPASDEPEPAAADLEVTVADRVGALTRPLAIFLDDFHWAGDDGWRRLGRLLELCADRPLWLIVVAEEVPARQRDRVAGLRPLDRIRLGPLTAGDLGEVAATLLDEEGPADELAALLSAASGGLPLAVVEQVNSLCDDGLLVAAGRRRWALEGDPGTAPSIALDLDRVIARRIGRLPSSTRRLMVLAAVIGQTFDVELLQRAAHEHMGVVEIGLETMLERWLVRQYARRWTEGPRERDLTLWAQGARRGSFEFAHARIRQVALDQVPPARCRTLHREIAEALTLRAEDGVETPPEVVAHHLLEAGETEAAGPYLAAAIERAKRLGDEAIALDLAATAAAGGGAQKKKRTPR